MLRTTSSLASATASVCLFDHYGFSAVLPSSTAISEAIASAGSRDARGLADAFRAVDDPPHQEGWLLLSELFRMMLKPRQPLEPFRPVAKFDGNRSLLPQDLDALTLTTLCELIEEVDDPEFRSRIGDVVWLTTKDPTAARTAVQGYLNSAVRLEDLAHWPVSAERYERAVRLARQLGREEPLLQQALELLEQRVRHYGGNDPRWFSCKLLSLLHEFGHGDPRELALLGERVARAAAATGEHRRARDYFDVQAKLLGQAGEKGAAVAAQIASAETWVAEAEAREADSYLASRHFWEYAITAFRQIPGQQDRLRMLHRRLKIASERAVAEMNPVGAEVEASGWIEASQTAVRGLHFDDAVYTMVDRFALMDPAALRAEAEAAIKDHPLSSLMETTILDAAGRKVGVRAAAITDDPNQREAAICGQMEWHAGIHRTLKAQGELIPAIQQIREEHDPDDATLEQLVDGNPFVPKDRLPIIVKGMRAGFELDLVTTLHLLVPQIENLLRLLLRHHGVIAESIDKVGIERTWNLNRILAQPELDVRLGTKLAFELRSIFTEETGPNFRNLLAHGLLNEKAFQSCDALHLWWLMLQLLIRPTEGFHAFAERIGG